MEQQICYKKTIQLLHVGGKESMKKMMNWLAAEESGQGMVEYALILALIAVAAIAILGTLGGKINSIFGKVNEQLNVK